MDDRGVHNLYKQLVSSGQAFGAKRWVTTLDRQCERLASAMATNISTGDVGGNHIFLIKMIIISTIFVTLTVDFEIEFSYNESRRKKEHVEVS